MSNTIYTPTIPMIQPISYGLRIGQLIKIQGVVNSGARCFAVNLQCGPSTNPRDDLALHFSPVFSPPPRVVRNSLQGQRWGGEESHGGFPFSAGSGFELLILTESELFKMAINGQHFTEFRHRLPIGRISHLSIDGDVTVNFVELDASGSSGAQTAPSAPLMGPQPLSGALPYPTSSSGMPPYPPDNPIGFPMPTPAQNPYPSGPPTGLPPAPAAYPSDARQQSYPPPGYDGQSYYPPGGQAYPPPGSGGGYPTYPASSNSSGFPGSAAAGGLLGAAAGAASQFFSGKHKKSNPIPIGGGGGGHMPHIPGIPSNVAGLAAGAGAAAVGAYALSKVAKPFKVKKLYKHKYKKPKFFKHKGWKHKGWSSSSSSSEEE